MRIVIAGSYRQYRNYLYNTGQTPKQATYISDSRQIQGLRNVEVRKVGTWWENPVWDDLAFEAQLHLAQQKVEIKCDPTIPPNTIVFVNGTVWTTTNIGKGYYYSTKSAYPEALKFKGEETMSDTVRKRVQALIDLLTSRKDLQEIQVDHKDGAQHLNIRIVRDLRYTR